MLNRFNPYTKKRSSSPIINRRSIETPSTESLEATLPPSLKKYITGTKTVTSTTKIVKEQKVLSTGSLENIVEPSDKKYETGVRSAPAGTKIVSDNIINDFHQEILQYSARYVKKHIDWWSEEENSITLANTLLDYGTEGPDENNFEVIVNGIHSPAIYTIKQDGNNIVVNFTERLFSFDGLQKENVIIIGKLLDIALITQQNDIVITDEDGEPLIL